MADETPWPPPHGLPPRERFIPAKDLRWGQTPFDNLSRGELLRLVQAYHAAAVSARSVIFMLSAGRLHAFWSPDGAGGRAQNQLTYLLQLAGDVGVGEDAARIYRCFFRTARGLLFEPVARPDDRWVITEKGEMWCPGPAPDGSPCRPVEWRDLLPNEDGADG